MIGDLYDLRCGATQCDKRRLGKKQRYKQLTNNMKKKCRRNPVRGSKRVSVGKIGFGVVPKKLCRQNQVRGVPKKFV